MSGEISKPDANPILFAILNIFFGCVGYFVMGQSKKGVFALIYYIVGVWCFFLPGLILLLCFVYDAYLLGQKLAAGESIGETEVGLSFLGNLPGMG